MKNTLLVIAISAALAACSSGSSHSTVNSGTKADTPNKTQIANKGKDNAKNNPQKEDTNDTAIKLTADVKTGKNESFSEYTPTEDLNKFVIDGKTITLAPGGISSGGFMKLNSTNGVNGDKVQRFISGTKYSQTKFGVLTKTGSDKIVAFSQGTPASSLPEEDGIKYKGDYIGYDHAKGLVGDGTLEMTVNFKTHTAKGSFTEDSNGFLGGELSGGTVNKNKLYLKDKAKGVEIKAQFYGKGATELGGVYYHKNQYTAAFGAKKQ